MSWRFYARSDEKILYLFDVGSVRIERHTKVKGAASPDDPTLLDYWAARQDERKILRRRQRVAKTLTSIESEARAL